MSYFNFLLTYSTSPRGDDDIYIKTADKLRKKLAGINEKDWHKLDEVETTYVGKVDLKSVGVDNKRNEAEKIITAIFKEKIYENDTYDYTWVNIALMIDGLGEHIKVRI
ncbi:hypothetical protein WCT88_06590 [Pectobacterium carotovorum]|uniref:hypothetical protein n=1 Tax=Pectobacterium carotovorum TaxID=554 RepID=UPI00254B8B4F|nr:hypothetical protein [Pectobacterium carotovorum]MDK9422121.1 hypothetical protein [Pectobacterium carotovorum]